MNRVNVVVLTNKDNTMSPLTFFIPSRYKIEDIEKFFKRPLDDGEVLFNRINDNFDIQNIKDCDGIEGTLIVEV